MCGQLFHLEWGGKVMGWRGGWVVGNGEGEIRRPQDQENRSTIRGDMIYVAVAESTGVRWMTIQI